MAFTPRRLMRGASVTGVSDPDSTYQISRSLRFNKPDTAYLSRTPSVDGNRRTWTFSTWIKRSSAPSDEIHTIFSAGIPLSGGYLVAFFLFYNQLDLAVYNSSGTVAYRITSTALFRDVSAWYHVMAVVDSTQATASNRLKLYVNGVQVTAFSAETYPSQNDIFHVNYSTVAHYIGTYAYNTSVHHNDCYQTDTYLIDGQQLTPSSFGETNARTGVWQPKAYSGSYGTNGFYLNFSDNSNTTAATLGKDYSGNGNNWTPNNFSVTAGAGNDSLVDVPTSYGTDTGVGGEVRGNYATLNPLHGVATSGAFYLTNGNLDLNVLDNSGYRNFAATISPEGFKGYCEVRMATDPNFQIGFAFESILPSNTQYQTNPPNAFYMSGDGNFRSGQTVVRAAYTPSFASGDILQIAFDFTGGARNIWFGRNGTWGTSAAGLGVPATGTNPIFTVSDLSQACRFYFGVNTGAATVTINVNFGQRAFSYTAPTGFKALCTRNLPVPTIGATSTTLADDYFGIATYTGNGTARSLSLGFQPDFTWIKNRNSTYSHLLVDSIRGGSNYLSTNNTTVEQGGQSLITSWDSNGVNLGTWVAANENTLTFVAWNWKAGGTAVTNTSGTISSQVSASPRSGFSIVTFTTDGTTKTFGHGLGVKPSLIIAKSRSDVGYWNAITDADGSMKYNGMSGAGFDTIAYSAPTSTVFQYNDGNGKTHVAYCFASIEGFSKIGVYTGNGSINGPFVYTGFRPRLIMIKRMDSSGNWLVQDNARTPFNWTCNMIAWDLNNAENTGEDQATYGRDYLSNGFKIRASHSSHNFSGGTYLYVAFAESPFKTSLAR